MQLQTELDVAKSNELSAIVSLKQLQNTVSLFQASQGCALCLCLIVHILYHMYRFAMLFKCVYVVTSICAYAFEYVYVLSFSLSLFVCVLYVYV